MRTVRLADLAWRHRDPLIALGLAVLAVLPPETPTSRPEAVRIALGLAGTLPIALRRARPLVTFVAIAGAIATSGALGLEVTAAWLALGLAAYTLAAACGPRIAFSVVAAGTAAALGAPSVGGGKVDSGWFFGGFLLVAVATLLGDRVFARRAVAAAAVRDERERIARDLHDSLAHALSAIVVQADAADVLIERDPARAHGAVSAIRETGRSSLTDLRRIVGAVRADEDDGTPGVHALPGLVAELREGGVAAELVVEGAERALPALVEQSAYRIVQEALTNVRRHARAARARVVVRFEDDALGLEITDDGTAASEPAVPGHGLLGMRERARLCGGVLSAGPREGGGFEVIARLPLAGGR
ncbi:MAG: histidine kinase [Gaiellales bacterium]